ncbi:hypothetical protein IWZ01DRAFT_186437 [Phyllosticta capitalensis]
MTKTARSFWWSLSWVESLVAAAKVCRCAKPQVCLLSQQILPRNRQSHTEPSFSASCQYPKLAMPFGDNSHHGQALTAFSSRQTLLPLDASRKEKVRRSQHYQERNSGNQEAETGERRCRLKT